MMMIGDWWLVIGDDDDDDDDYPLGNVDIAMENHHVSWGKPTISMAMFSPYFDITRWYLDLEIQWSSTVSMGSWEQAS